MTHYAMSMDTPVADINRVRMLMFTIISRLHAMLLRCYRAQLHKCVAPLEDQNHHSPKLDQNPLLWVLSNVGLPHPIEPKKAVFGPYLVMGDNTCIYESE